MNDDGISDLLARLARDRFRQRFSLRDRELAHLQTWGLEKVMRDARQLLARRVAPAEPANDGRQTPWRNHPVFVAQHATATCCRGCIEKWHSIPRGHALSPEEMDRLLSVIRAWLESYVEPSR